jgi:hypothetical protein
MTRDQFLRYYPQFTDFPPAIVLRKAIRQANARFNEFDEDREEARRLYIAHKLTMYAYSFPAAGGGDNETVSPAAIIAAGKAAAAQQATSKKVGEVSVTYSSGFSASSVDTGFADLKETAFGLQLLSLIRMHARPRYIP